VADWLLPTVSSNYLKVTKHKDIGSVRRLQTLAEGSVLKGLCAEPTFQSAADLSQACM